MQNPRSYNEQHWQLGWRAARRRADLLSLSWHQHPHRTPVLSLSNIPATIRKALKHSSEHFIVAFQLRAVTRHWLQLGLLNTFLTAIIRLRNDSITRTGPKKCRGVFWAGSANYFMLFCITGNVYSWIVYQCTRLVRAGTLLEWSVAAKDNDSTRRYSKSRAAGLKQRQDWTNQSSQHLILCPLAFSGRRHKKSEIKTGADKNVPML